MNCNFLIWQIPCLHSEPNSRHPSHSLRCHLILCIFDSSLLSYRWQTNSLTSVWVSTLYKCVWEFAISRNTDWRKRNSMLWWFCINIMLVYQTDITYHRAFSFECYQHSFSRRFLFLFSTQIYSKEFLFQVKHCVFVVQFSWIVVVVLCTIILYHHFILMSIPFSPFHHFYFVLIFLSIHFY